VEENANRKYANILLHIQFQFEYLLSVNIICLIMKTLNVIQYFENIGPLVKIVSKMSVDFINFLILYLILVMMFAIVGNLNFIFDLKEQFGGLFESCLTVLDASIGNYDFQLFKEIDDGFLSIFGDLYIMCIVITFNILILNLIIAILSNTYNMFDTKSRGLYLSKLLNSRDDMAPDDHYGAFLLTMTPLNFVVLPFVPYALFVKPSKRFNTIIMILQYSVLIIIIYGIFLICSILLSPFAYIRSLGIKFGRISRASTFGETLKALLEFLVFFVFGVVLLVMNYVSDFYYFWANNFRSNLKKIIIER